MPIEFPMFGDEHGLTCCVCGEIDAGNGTVKKQKARVAQFATPQGKVFIRAWIDTEPKQRLYVNWARADCFEDGESPKVTTDKTDDVLHIVESALGLTVQATVCASFTATLSEFPEHGIIRPMLSESKSSGVSVQMTSAKLAFTGLPIGRLEWEIINPKEENKILHIELKGRRKFKVGDTYLTDAWRWINEQFSVFVLGRGQSSPRSEAK